MTMRGLQGKPLGLLGVTKPSRYIRLANCSIAQVRSSLDPEHSRENTRDG